MGRRGDERGADRLWLEYISTNQRVKLKDAAVCPFAEDAQQKRAAAEEKDPCIGRRTMETDSIPANMEGASHATPRIVFGGLDCYATHEHAYMVRGCADPWVAEWHSHEERAGAIASVQPSQRGLRG